jgi:8-oxo-dGTP diphosphatase
MTHRNMASIIIRDGGKFLLLHKQTRYSDRPLWIPGAGGHFERDELNNPEACLWREVAEETGLTPAAFENVKLRYIALRNSGEQIRQNYYFFGDLREGVSRDITNNEGELHWFALGEIQDCAMPLTFQAAMNHYLDVGCHDEVIYVAVGSANENGDTVYVFTPLIAY